ncbi:DNA-3-methyladenine glycosylase [Herbiconiux sp. CPCC 203407]|uniref:Putative 3-methyladenine DNA glycosylase n=1 Tax=Herbiconiux oxytropis TaxID=2970915 RepID=A0AA41X9W0_9MICO|nr:DNA-3-methyladenine glycosylase [Herbiconiux oxytropis]MCS5720795.1 DNA-3-methyladenine glycosylase [Herbiconiux oxytropis]MCS5724272.1 DNA-3-methyladenine glycosylase [Herbiconiux oxytropis]
MIDFSADALEVAPFLLGAVLSHDSPEGVVAVRITEVEAYLGEGVDPGSHAFRGRSKRTASMFGEPGRLYSYFTYGMHVCANVVCSPQGEASAVLLRGGEIVIGTDLARVRRPTARSDHTLARGPANLVRALGIALGEDGSRLDVAPFGLVPPASVATEVAVSLRTGVSGAGGVEPFAWRFFLPGEPTVSPYKRHPKAGSADFRGDTPGMQA